MQTDLVSQGHMEATDLDEQGEIHWYDRLLVSYGDEIASSLKRRYGDLSDAQLLIGMERTRLFDVKGFVARSKAHHTLATVYQCA